VLDENGVLMSRPDRFTLGERHSSTFPLTSVLDGNRVLMPRPNRFTLGDRGVKVQLYFFFNLGARWKWVVNATPRPLCPRGRGPGTHRARGFEGLKDGQKGCGKSHPTGADKTGTVQKLIAA